mmetsp:Transcript_6805/g.14124  ORF Transcript_6805/g.14124 Transcript_6805/m.14124 type:complete len:206 (-) Transcript_6805:180-797(-)
MHQFLRCCVPLTAHGLHGSLCSLQLLTDRGLCCVRPSSLLAPMRLYFHQLRESCIALLGETLLRNLCLVHLLPDVCVLNRKLAHHAPGQIFSLLCTSLRQFRTLQLHSPESLLQCLLSGAVPWRRRCGRLPLPVPGLCRQLLHLLLQGQSSRVGLSLTSLRYLELHVECGLILALLRQPIGLCHVQVPLYLQARDARRKPVALHL